MKFGYELVVLPHMFVTSSLLSGRSLTGTDSVHTLECVHFHVVAMSLKVRKDSVNPPLTMLALHVLVGSCNSLSILVNQQEDDHFAEAHGSSTHNSSRRCDFKLLAIFLLNLDTTRCGDQVNHTAQPARWHQLLSPMNVSISPTTTRDFVQMIRISNVEGESVG